MPTLDDSPTLAFATPDAFEAWIAQQSRTSPGVWIKIAKKGARAPSITYAEALDIALCHGWIDSLKRPLDGFWWRQRFTPRKSRSKWSQINCTKTDGLIASGRMKPAGLAEIERAKADGRWDAAYAGQATAHVPADLQAALDANAKAAAFFATIDRANRYAILHRIEDARRPETRAARIVRFTTMLERGECIHQPSKPPKGSG